MSPVVDPAAPSRVVWALRRAFVAVEHVKDQRLRTVGVTPAQYGLLMHVAGTAGLTASEIARRLGVSPQNVATMATRMEDVGWITREAHERHPHVRELHLTDAGRAHLEAADAEVSALEDVVRAHLGADAEALRGLLETLAGLDASVDDD
ncbi:MarR family transcriptional regulator [Nocardioides sp. TRM66260-LWL]|uniref:MarR family winged helix-turn-helix transcriptional regulator n=1 Tax=Nocardioides sp. TRM66260-LWL TaxID=2874478 RepID=UPI001CC50470|nr:MarR family transcriptional regulator [Nocardioides sp. TRM66260-LWL]MBZ5736124.1 MarR family transcriptional regulator [Nocardioides sp. TRM66260-LWL]